MPEGSGGKKTGRVRSDSHVRAEIQEIVLMSIDERPGIVRSTSDDSNILFMIIPTSPLSVKQIDDEKNEVQQRSLATKRKNSVWQNDGGGSDMEGNESSFDCRRSYQVGQKRQSHWCSLDQHGGQAGVRPQKGKQPRVLQYCQKVPGSPLGHKASGMAGKGTGSLPELKSKKSKKCKKQNKRCKSFESLISKRNLGLSYLKQAFKQKAVDSGDYVSNQYDQVESNSNKSTDGFSKVLHENSDFKDNKELDKTVVNAEEALYSDGKLGIDDKNKLLKKSNRKGRSGKKSENSDASLKEKKENVNGELIRRHSKGCIIEQDQNSMLEKQKLKREALEDGEKMDKSKEEAKFPIKGKVELLKDKENRENTILRNEEEFKRIKEGIEQHRRKVEEKEKRQKEEIDRLIAIRDKKRMEDQAVTKDEAKLLVVNMEPSLQKKNWDAPSNKTDYDRICDQEETNLKQALDPLAVKLEEKHDVEKDVDGEGDDEKHDGEKDVDCDGDVEKQDDEKLSESEGDNESVYLKSHNEEKDGLRVGESGGFDVMNDTPYPTMKFKSDYNLDKEGRSGDLDENYCSFDSYDSCKSLDCSLSSWEKCTGAELCSSIPAVDQWQREDLCWLMLHQREDMNKLVEEFRYRFCKKEHDIKRLSTVIEKIINSGIRNSDNYYGKSRKENLVTEKQTVSGVPSKYDVEKVETEMGREDSDNLHDEEKEDTNVEGDSEAVDKSCRKNTAADLEVKSEEELVCPRDDVVEETVDEHAALENASTSDDNSEDNFTDNETDVEIIDAEEKDGQEKEADSAKIKERKDQKIKERKEELKGQKMKEREELKDQKMKEREEECEDDDKDNLVRGCKKVFGGNGRKPGKKTNLPSGIYSLNLQVMECCSKVNELDAEINEGKLKAEKLMADIILALEAIGGYKGGAVSNKQQFMHHHGFKKTRSVLKVDMNEWRQGKQQRSNSWRDFTKISKARQKKPAGHSWIRRSSGGRGHELFRCGRYGRQCSEGTSGSGRRQNSKEGSGSGNSRNNADKNSKNDNNQQNRDTRGDQNNNNNPDKNTPNDAKNPVQTPQENSATREFTDANIPDPDFKGPRKKVTGEISDVKHTDLDNFEWLDKIVIFIQEDGGPSLRFFQAVDNSVYVCISMCLMNPEQLSAEGFLCSVCLTVDSLLKHFANCSASFNCCDMCVKMFTLICSHVSECKSANAVFECEISICRIVNSFLDGNDIMTHMKTLWFQVRKKLARIIGVEVDDPEPVTLPRTLEDRPLIPSPRGHPKLSGRHSGPLPSIPELAPLSITSTSRSSSKILMRKRSTLASVGEQQAANGIHSVDQAGAVVQRSQTSSVIYQRVETSTEGSEPPAVRPETEQDALPTSSEEGSAESVESGSGSGNYPYSGRNIVSMPIGPPVGAEPYYPSFQDTPTGIKGIGEVVYANKQQLVKVVTIWEQFKVQYRIEAKLAKHYREEGVILYEFRNKLKINGLRYNRDFQWIKTAHLGNGMTGKCLLATDFETDFKFCVKELHIANYEKQEIELWLELEHPHIVQVYGAIRHGEKIYILQEFIEGGCLTEAINVQKKLGRRLSQVIALKYFNQLLQVLKYLKSKNILHEDLKADNILLNNTGNGVSIKVTDFGLARRCQGIVRQGTAPVGTQTQWSPEKAKAEGYSFSAEVWAAVCVLVHMLSGLPPWMRRYETFKALIVVIVEKSPPIEDIPRNILPQIKELIHCGFTVNPSQRPTAEQLLNHEAFRILEEPQATATYSILESVHHTSTNHIDDDPNADLREIYRNLISEGKGATGAAPSKLPEINPEYYQHSNDYYVYTAHQTGGEVGQGHDGSQGQGQSMTLDQEDNGRRAPHMQHDMEILHQQISRSGQGRPRRPSQPDQNMDPSEHYEQFYNDDLTNVVPPPAQSNLTMYYPSDGSDVHNSQQESVGSSSSESITRKIPDFTQLVLSSDSEGKSVHRVLPDFQSRDFSEDEEEAKPPKEEISFEDAIKHFGEHYLPTVISTPDLSPGSKTSSVINVQGPSRSRENAAVSRPVSQSSGETVQKEEHRRSITPNRRSSDGNGLMTTTSTINPDNSGSVRQSPVISFPSTPSSHLTDRKFSNTPDSNSSSEDDPIKSINNDDDLFKSGSPPQNNQHGVGFANPYSSWHPSANREPGPQGPSSYVHYAPGPYVPQTYASRSSTAETHAASQLGYYQPDYGTSWQNTGYRQHMPNVPSYQTNMPSNHNDHIDVKQELEGNSVMPKPNILPSSVSQRFPSPQSTSPGHMPGGFSHGMVRTNYESSSLPSPYSTAQMPGQTGTRLVPANPNRQPLPTEIYYHQQQNLIYQQQYQNRQISPSGQDLGHSYSPVNHGHYSQSNTKFANSNIGQGDYYLRNAYSERISDYKENLTAGQQGQNVFTFQGQGQTWNFHGQNGSLNRDQDPNQGQGHQNQYGPVSLPTSRDSNVRISPREPQSLMNSGHMGHFNPMYTSTPTSAVPYNGARPKIFLPGGPQQGANVGPRQTANMYDRGAEFKQELTKQAIIDPRQAFLSDSGLRFSPMTTRAPYPQQPKTPILNPSINPRPDILPEGVKADLRLDINKAKQMSGPTAVSITKTAPVITPPKTPSKKSPDLQRSSSHAPLIARNSPTLSNSAFSPNQRDDKMSSSTSRSQFEEQDEAFRELEHTAEEALSQHSDPEHRIFLNIYDHDDIDKPIVGELDGIDLENPAASLAHMLDTTEDNSVTVTFRSTANSKEFKMRFEARTSLKHWEKIIKEELDGFSRLRMTEEYGLQRFCLKKEDGSVLDLESCLGSRRSQVMLMVEAVDNDPWWIEDGMISM